MTDDSTCQPLSALLSFTAENARSYRDEVNLSLLAGRLSPKSIVRTLPTAGQPVRVLPAVGIFGANASGKSTLLKAMADMRTLVVDSFRMGDNPSDLAGAGVLRRHPFLLTPSVHPEQDERIAQAVRESRERSTRYVVDLVIDNIRWQYGVDVGNEGVASEYAYHYPNGRQALVFRRECDSDEDEDVVWGPTFRAQGRNLEQFARRHALLLSVAGTAGWEPVNRLYSWFQHNLGLSESTDRRKRTTRVAQLLERTESRAQVLALLRAADLGILDASREPIPPEIKDRVSGALRAFFHAFRETGEESPDEDVGDVPLDDVIRFIHRGPWGSSSALSTSDESLGTLVWVELIGPVLEALEQGSVLLVDELDASLHPHLVRDLVELFQSPRRNPNAAQLIFNAHDVTLLGDSSERTLSRDQVWITEKQSDGTTSLYPLSDFRPRHDEAIARRYLQGRYGGVPTTNPAEYVRATEPTDT